MKYTVAKSNIQGKGLFAKEGYKKGEIIGLSHVDNKPTGQIGKYHNHSDKPTAVNIKKGNQRFLIANVDIPSGVEITTNYRKQPKLEQPEDFQQEVKTGGDISIPSLNQMQGGGESKPRKVRREVKPFTTSNLKEYQKRKQAYDDSLTLYNASLQEHDLLKKTKGVAAYDPLYDKEAYDAYKRLGYPKGYNVDVKRTDNTNTRSVMYEKPVQPVNKKTKPVPKKPQQVNKKSKKVDPFVTSDPKEYALRKAAYDDSLRTYQMAPNLKRKENYIDAHSLSMKDNRQQLFNLWKQYGDKGFNFDLGYNQRTSPKRKVSDGVIGHQIYDYKKPVQPVQFKKPKSTQGVTKKIQPIVEQEVIEPTLVSQPIPTPIIVNPELQKFVEEEREPGTGSDVMPVYDTNELPMYATPDRDAQWVGHTEKYIDWDGNKIPYRLPRFRKPGHSGDLIRKGKKRYISFPSIESRYQAEIIPEEEFAMGGQYIELDLTPEQITKYTEGGYIIEEVH